MASRFRPGEVVAVRDAWPDHHVRTPAYVRGKNGRVTAVHGCFPNPETLAYGQSGLPEVRLYTVEFSIAELWPSSGATERDRVLVDIYDHWLSASEAT